jgi:hypothetical protein
LQSGETTNSAEEPYNADAQRETHNVIVSNSLLTKCVLGCAMAEETQALVLEILRQIQADIVEMKADIKHLKAGMFEIRTQLLTIQRQRTIQ